MQQSFWNLNRDNFLFIFGKFVIRFRNYYFLSIEFFCILLLFLFMNLKDDIIEI